MKYFDKIASPEIVKGMEDKVRQLKESGKPPKIAAVLTSLPLELHIEEHFKNLDFEYAWSTYPIQPSQSKEHAGLFLGLWLSEKIPYIHLVLASEDVLNYVLNLKQNNEVVE